MSWLAAVLEHMPVLNRMANAIMVDGTIVGNVSVGNVWGKSVLIKYPAHTHGTASQHANMRH
jgi:hypothetical protein